jgi:NADPH:quinone reductase
VRVAVSGIHAGDLGKRRGWWGSTMAFPRVIPHGDGAGVIDAVGAGAGPDRVGQRVWVFLAQSYRPFGTAAEYVTVPAAHAVVLPDQVPLEQGALLGIAGITGHRAIFADGPVAGQTIVVTGAAGAVGRAAVAVARRGGATVVDTVRRAGQVQQALTAGAHHVVDVAGRSSAEAAQQILAVAADGVDRVAEVAFDTGIATDLEILKYHGVVATYASGADEPSVPYWSLGFKNIAVRFLSKTTSRGRQPGRRHRADRRARRRGPALPHRRAVLPGADRRRPRGGRAPVGRRPRRHRPLARCHLGSVDGAVEVLVAGVAAPPGAAAAEPPGLLAVEVWSCRRGLR